MTEILHFISRELLNPTTRLGELTYGLFYLGCALIGTRLIKLWRLRLAEHPDLIIDRTNARFIGHFLNLLCFLLAITAYAHTVPALYKIGTALLASAGVLSVILGIAAQNTLGNMIAGVALLFYRPYGIGDVLVLNTPTGKETGTVKDFSLGYTKLVTEDGRWIIAPNSLMISSILIRVK